MMKYGHFITFGRHVNVLFLK